MAQTRPHTHTHIYCDLSILFDKLATNKKIKSMFGLHFLKLKKKKKINHFQLYILCDLQYLSTFLITYFIGFYQNILKI